MMFINTKFKVYCGIAQFCSEYNFYSSFKYFNSNSTEVY